MLVNITERQLQRLIDLLQKNGQDQSDFYLKNYLQYVQNNEASKAVIDLEEIPF